MHTFRNGLSHAANARKFAGTFAKRIRFVFPIALVALTVGGAARAEDSGPLSFSLAPPAGVVAACFQNATARVTVFPREEGRGVDTLDLKAQGLPPNTEFTVFLCELANPPFGAVEYIGDFETNAAGRGSLRVDTIVEEAFALTVDQTGAHRTELNHVVVWFADPADDDGCFVNGGGPVTPFDGDGVAGVTILSSANALPGAPLP